MKKPHLRMMIGLFVTLSVAVTGRSACAQPAAEPLGAGPANFGSEDAVVDEIGWSEILPPFSGNYYGTTVINGAAYRTLFASSVSLGRIPHGARLLGFNIYYFNHEPGNALEVSYCRAYVDSGTGEPKGLECPAHGNLPPTAEKTGALGNLLVPAAFQTVLRRDDVDGDGSYEAIHHYLFLSAVTGNMGVHSIRPRWLRQVSPGPVTGTFNDVPPSDGAFAFIEAMAASGITAGRHEGLLSRRLRDTAANGRLFRQGARTALVAIERDSRERGEP